MTEPHAAADGFTVAVTDGRRSMAYLVAPESDDYIAIMAVLESSVTDLTPAEVAVALRGAGTSVDERTVEARLDKLRDWTAVSARTDTSRILRHADLLARNWRYTATPAGRQVQRFYATVLAGTPTMREIPLSSLARVVAALEALAAGPTLPGAETAEHIGRLFTSHDDLDGALVGAEDALAGLADRFDLDHDATGELKRLLVEYATRVAGELESGSARAAAALSGLAPRFAALVAATVETSDARTLIERGALTASRGGRVADWTGLAEWFDPHTGRAARFALRLVRALPGMHANLRRLHSSTGTATSRARALQLAKAAADPTVGTAVLLAALGDHPWRKLYDDADDADLPRNPSWRGGPAVSVPPLLRSTGRTGARGRPPASRDDSAARAAVAAARAQRAAEHAVAVAEVLAARPGAVLSFRAADVALASLMAAARAGAGGDRRTATCDGLACTLFHTGAGVGVLRAPSWRIWLPGRLPVFHQPGARPMAPVATTADPDERVSVVVGGAA
jgi:uncharacterized protein (TIGR02677 family)